MKYVSTRGSYPAVPSAEAITLGLVPDGGLFVPESFPLLAPSRYAPGLSYQSIAHAVFTLYLTDFSSAEIDACISSAYNTETFSAPSVISLLPLHNNQLIMELFHGPTAAFKDVALQIMPHLLTVAKNKLGATEQTVILVATSGDTGKAALEGFKNIPGITIIVFYPDGGVSEIQRLQMVTTNGTNTTVVAVKGNFDDCQTGVKTLFSDSDLRRELAAQSAVFSSANSINWGRLCPQIVYYFAAYSSAVDSGTIQSGDKVNFCIPTGNFGNILSGYYARQMGLPIGKLICASNKNRILSDFFATGTYNRNRPFYRTNAPSMDILISSNLERFLYAVTGQQAEKVSAWYNDLAQNGTFTIDPETKKAIDAIIVSGWVDEDTVAATIKTTFQETGYILDTHTAVAVALSAEQEDSVTKTIIAATASPYKFSRDVLRAIDGSASDDEFSCIEKLSAYAKTPVHRAVANIRERHILHNRAITIDDMKETVLAIRANS